MVRQTKFNKSGFSILELIIVITIIGILSSVLLAHQTGKERTAKVQTAAAEVGEIVGAASRWRENQGSVLFTGISIANIVGADLYPRTTHAFAGAIAVDSINNNRGIRVTLTGINDAISASNIQSILSARGGKNATVTGVGPYSVYAEY